jgi:Domain of unknown function (DUF4440)
MRSLLSCALLLSVALAAPSAAQAATCGDQNAELRSIKLDRWPGFYRNQDVVGLGAFLDDAFVVIDSRGKVTTKAEELKWLANNPWSPSDFVYEISSITCPTADLAVIIGQGRSTRLDGQRRFTHYYVSSNVLMKSSSGWRAITSHVSGERHERVN